MSSQINKKENFSRRTFKLFERTLFFRTNFFGVSVIRVLFICTFFQHFISWLFVEIFGDGLWFDGGKTIVKSTLLSATADGGYVEHFANMFLFWSFILSSYLVYKYFRYSFVIPLVYLFLFLDDSLSFHERFVAEIVPNFLKNKIQMSFIGDFAEIFMWLIVFISFLILVSLCLKKMNFIEKKFVAYNFFFFVLLSFFAIFVDQIIAIPQITQKFWHGSAWSSFSSFILFSLSQLEEWGEIFSVGFAFLWLFNTTCDLKFEKK